MNSTYFVEKLVKDGKEKYSVYRLKDTSKLDTEDNREYTGTYEDYYTAYYVADDLNITIPADSIMRMRLFFTSSFTDVLKEHLSYYQALKIESDFLDRFYKKADQWRIHSAEWKLKSVDWKLGSVDRLISFFMSSITEALKKYLSPELALKIQGDFFTRLFSADKKTTVEVSNETKEKA